MKINIYRFLRSKIKIDFDASDLIDVKFKIPRFALLTVLTVFVLTGLIVLINFLSEPTSFPNNLSVSNQTNSKATVFYSTTKPALGIVLVSKDKWKVMVPYFNRFLADRFIDDSFALNVNHHINLTGLLPDTKYYYAISTGWNTYLSNSNGRDLPELKTLGENDIKPVFPNPAYGRILYSDNHAASGVVVFFKGKNKIVSGITDNLGRWAFDISSVQLDSKTPMFVLDGKVVEGAPVSVDKLQPALTMILKK